MQNIYSVFDGYLARSTWHTSHDNEGTAFYLALNKVVKDPQFNPDTMGEYMRSKKGVSAEDADQTYYKVIKKRVTEAWGIKDYLKTNGL